MGKGEGKGEGPIGSACTCVGLLGELLCDCARCKCEEALKDFICIPVKFMCALLAMVNGNDIQMGGARECR